MGKWCKQCVEMGYPYSDVKCPDCSGKAPPRHPLKTGDEDRPQSPYGRGYRPGDTLSETGDWGPPVKEPIRNPFHSVFQHRVVDHVPFRHPLDIIKEAVMSKKWRTGQEEAVYDEFICSLRHCIFGNADANEKRLAALAKLSPEERSLLGIESGEVR